MKLKKKVLIGVSTRNTPHFLRHFIRSFEMYDPGYPCDLLIVDEGSDNPQQLKLLEKLSKKYMVNVRDSTGRAQGTYEYVRKNYRNQYEYYFLMHNDSAILRSNWLSLIVKRINDESYVEPGLEDYPDIAKMPVGKAGFQGYQYGTLEYYLAPLKFQNTTVRGPYYYGDILLKHMGLEIPPHGVYQLINDDRHLWKNELFSKIDVMWNVEEFRKHKDTDMFKNINEFYNQNFTKIQYLEPKHIYNGNNWEGFQGVSEFMTSLAPARFGYRTHCMLGPGWLQEKVGWTEFWGLEYINHYGSHNFYKRMSLLHKVEEHIFRQTLKNEAALITYDKMVKKETNWVEAL